MRYTILTILIVFCSLIPITKKFLKSYRHPPQFRIEYLAKKAEDFGSDFDLTLIENHQFHYIGHGDQAIAFADESETYVLKLFLYQKIHGKKWFPKLFAKKNKKRNLARQKRLDQTLKNYSIAFDKMKESTGMIAMHCSRKKLPFVTLIDWENRSHHVDLTGVPFVLQHKAVPVVSKMEETSEEFVISSLHQFIEAHARDGFVDTELGFVPQNYGFIGNRLVYIDLGKIEFNESVGEVEIQRMQGHLLQWLFLHKQVCK